MEIVELLVVVGLVYLFLTMTPMGADMQETLNIDINLPEASVSGGNGSSSTTIINNTQTVVQKANLCAVLQPYLIPTDLQGACTVGGGQYVCDPTHVGCYGATASLNVSAICTSALYQTSAYQCQAMGGVSVCNEHNLYCQYS